MDRPFFVSCGLFYSTAADERRYGKNTIILSFQPQGEIFFIFLSQNILHFFHAGNRYPVSR